MLLLLALLSPLALSSTIPADEVLLGINPSTSPGLRNALLSDAFSRLDVNQDGLLTKVERKPIFDDGYIFFADLFTTKDDIHTVMKGDFVTRVVAPDMADTQNPTQEQCELEAAFVKTSGDDLWRGIFGDVASVTVLEFASKLYDALEDDIPMNLVEFMDAWTKRASSNLPFNLPTAQKGMHVYKLDSYTELHNQQCATQRRQLFVTLPVVADIAFNAVVKPLFVVTAAAAAECVGQQIAYSLFPRTKSFFLPFYEGGCTWNQYKQDWVVTAGVYGFLGAGRSVVSWVGRSLGFGGNLAATTSGYRVATSIGTQTDDLVQTARTVSRSVGEDTPIGTVVDAGTDVISQADIDFLNSTPTVPSVPEPTTLGQQALSIIGIRRRMREMAAAAERTKKF